jgi:hypothetical protein
MARKRKAAKKAAPPKCGICAGLMKLKRVIPAAHIFPELKTYQCRVCGNLRTVEDEAELAIPEMTNVAA